MSNTEAVDVTKARLVYVGAKRHQGRLVHVYTRVTNNELASQAMIFGEILCQCDPGTIVEVKCTGNDVSNIIGLAKVVGQWEVEGDVVSWQAAHRALTASTMALDGSLPDAMRFALEPIRVAYLDGDDMARQVLLAQVVQFIVGGP